MATAEQLKQRIRDGEVVVALRVPVDIGRAALEAALSRADYDLLYVDGQHTAFSEDNLVALGALAEELDLPLQLRLPHTRHTYLIGRYLDFGPTAIMVPEVSHEAEVDEAVGYAYYPPVGRRSWGGVARRGLSAGRDRLAYAAWWNETVVLGIQLESVEAIAGAGRLAKPGVDYIAFGPSDLSFSLEANPDFRWRTVDDCMRAVAEQVSGTGVRLGTAIATKPEERDKYLAIGITMFQEHPR